MKPRILVVDDEPEAVELVEFNLKQGGFDVISAGDGVEALKKAREQLPALIVLDVMLPEVDGMEICKTLRRDKNTAKIPVIMLTARAAEIDRVLGLELGADDYITKPFSPRELVLRIKKLLQRGGGGPQEAERLSVGALLIDSPRHLVSWKGKSIELTATEFKLLALLAHRRGRVQSREQLLRDVWDLRSRAQARGIHLLDHTPPIQVRADPIRLEQVLGNLVDNAIKYGRSSGNVIVGAREAEDQQTELFVQDDGPGIPPEALERDSKVLNSYGHAVPIVAGQLQRAGADAKAVVLKNSFTDQEDVLDLDIRSAYGLPELKKLERTFIYERNNPALIVEDAVEFAQPKPFESALITWSEWKQTSPNEIRLTDGHDSARVEIDTGGVPFSIKAEKIDEDVHTPKKPVHIGIILEKPVRQARVRMTITKVER